ncbi:MAG: hypothetical protein H6525_03530 [Actinobacteria bacterium]|nr:hypothetical protein [Actinomycetota bacterium]MCB9411906.1 hypothetical protein [Actinomycetota bacterium]
MTATPAPAESTADLDLLRRFEPVIRFNRGELFYPTSVADFVASSALFSVVGKETELIAERGTLDLQTLAAAGREHAGAMLYLQQVDAPLDRKQYRQWKRREDRERFRFSSRFAAVGLVGRFVDAIMRLTLLLRGNVPGGYAAAAHLAYRATPRSDECFYYGHVSRDAGYVVLQYWYFYSMNDWRSTFGGVNDHESDWEQVTVFLTEDLEPSWVAFSSHDEVGDDLRRRWDDPDIEFVDGTHPVVYAGAGSHSGAYLPGEYLITAPLPIPEWLDGIRRGIIRLLPWRGQAGQGTVGIPYIDYKRGDGLSVGVDQDRPWQAVVVDDDTDWVRDFRGLWGLDTRDFLGGERAPAGMRYERDGTVRASWGQPVAWAGLDREAPSEAWAMRGLEAASGELQVQLRDLTDRLSDAREELRAARTAERAQGRSPQRPTPELTELSDTVARLRAEQVQLVNRIEAAELGIESATLPTEDVHAHLSHRAVPMAAADTVRGRLLRIWSAASASVLLAAFGILLLAGHSGLLWPVLWISFAMLVIESILRQRFLQLLVVSVIVAVTVILALAVWEIFTGNPRIGFGILLLVIAFYLVLQTAREAIRTR